MDANTVSSPDFSGPARTFASAQAASQARQPMQRVVSTSTPRASGLATATAADADRGAATSAAAPAALTLKNVRRLSLMTASLPRHAVTVRHEEADADGDQPENRERECEDHCDPSFLPNAGTRAGGALRATTRAAIISWNNGHAW